jgi:DNA replication and repair protein RecF
VSRLIIGHILIIIFKTDFKDSKPVILKSLTLKNFRSYRAETFTFDKRVNLIHGANAQGKTNLLEAVHFLLAFKPFKQVKHEELITFSAQECRIKGEIESSNGLDEVHIYIGGEKKTVRLNGKIVYRASSVLGRYQVVSFLPSDIELVKGSPQYRRRYLDALISALEPEYLRDLKQYHRALSQRNAVLSKSARLSPESLEVWDEKLAETGGKIVSRRKEYVKKMKPRINKLYRLTSGVDAQIDVIYRGSFNTGKDPANGLITVLKSNFEKDRKRGHTTAGPHRDVLTFNMSGKDTAAFASQGEAKNLAFALKASEIGLIKEMLGKTPVLLLDDVTSELDESRKKFIFRLLKDFSGQVFITTTSKKEIQYDGEMKEFYIKDGRAVQNS